MTRLQRLQATEFRILAVGGSPIDHGDYLVLQSARFPDWYQANMIELVRPGDRSLQDWEQVFRLHFDPAVYAHVTLYLRNPERFASVVDQPHASGHETEIDQSPWITQHITYMSLTESARTPPMPDELETRVVHTEKDWEALMEFSLEESRDEPWFTDEASCREFFELRRFISEQIGITWHTLHAKGDPRIISRLGVFKEGSVSRLQSIGTRAEHRRQGFASSLIRHAARVSLGQNATTELALAVESGSPAESVYESLGFEPVGSETWMMRYPRRASGDEVNR